MSQQLHFNILTFEPPKEPKTLYFSLTKQGECYPIHRYNFPIDISDTFPEIEEKKIKKIYTTFDVKREEFTPHTVDFKVCTRLFKHYLNLHIVTFFREQKGMLVTDNFIKDTQVWWKDEKASNSTYAAYLKFTLKLQFFKVSDYPELVVSYDGMSKVHKTPVNSLLSVISPLHIGKVVYENQFYHYQKSAPEELEKLDLNATYAIPNSTLAQLLGYSFPKKFNENKYVKYKKHIDAFCNTFLLQEDFKQLLPFNVSSFIKVPEYRVGRIKEDNNELLFRDGVGTTPKTDIKALKPLSKPESSNVHLFYIYHKSHLEEVKRLNGYLENGVGVFTGLRNYALIPFHTQQNTSIVYDDLS